MKIDRLMAITIYLLNHGKTSAGKLAEQFEVSPRTIMWDIDTLGQAGIPIQSTCGAEGGYQIMDTYVMEKQVASGGSAILEFYLQKNAILIYNR